MTRFHVSPGEPLRGRVRVAPDKSISHRAIIFGSVAEGVTRVSNLLMGEDVLATVAAFRQLGVDIEGSSNNGFVVHGVGLHGLSAPSAPLDFGNSGTAMRLVTGLLSGQRWSSRAVGDESLTGRPMKRIIVPLEAMGAVIESREGYPPLDIHPAAGLKGIHYDMPVASAQVKSALLLAGLYAEGRTSVTEPAPTRDHTERMLEGFGYAVERHDSTVAIEGGGTLQGCDVTVPADLSSSAFFLVAASVIRGSDIVLEQVGINPSRNGILPVLERMGADIEIVDAGTAGGEPVADLRVRSARLEGTVIEGRDVALAIDEIPVLSVAAAFAEGVTEIRDAAELRVKESDRIRSTCEGLRALGVEVEEREDGMLITGGPVSGGQVDSHGDHRIAMAFAMAGGAARAPVRVENCRNVATSFPGFADTASRAGLSLRVE